MLNDPITSILNWKGENIVTHVTASISLLIKFAALCDGNMEDLLDSNQTNIQIEGMVRMASKWFAL